jgi:type I restriction enzyme S subunit
MEKLLEGAEVEWKALEDVFNIKNGYTPSKSKPGYWSNGDIPWFRMDDIRQNGQILDNALQKVSKKAVKGGKLFPANSIIISTSATIGEHALIKVPYLSNQRFTNLSLKSSYSDKFEIKFLFYYSFLLCEWCKNNTRMSSFATVDMNGFKKLLIPIPCPNNPKKSLEIQTEIVRILDTFTELTAELTAELSARKKQYHYYRDQLLSFDEGEVDHLPMGQGGGDRSMSKLSYMEKLLDGVEVEWKTLEDVFNIKNGYTPSKSKPEYWSNGDIPWFRMDDIRQNGRILDIALQKVSKKAVKGGKLFPADSIIFSTSATIGEHALIKVPYLSNQQFTNLSLKSSYSDKIKFLFYYSYLLCEWCKNNTRMSSFATVDMNGFKKLLIPIPYPNNPEKSLEIQTEIVRILDKFDTLTSSISEGLPLEIKLRQQQYEYYRNLLLSFPKPEVAA